MLGGAGKCSSEEGARPRRLQRGAWAVPPRTEILGLDPEGNGSQGRPGSRAGLH